MFTITQRGNFQRTEQFLKRMRNRTMYDHLENLAREGVDALQSATPIDSALTAASWGYQIDDDGDTIAIAWINTNENQGVRIAVILQYGHGTGTGGYVTGQDYINPAIRPVFDKIVDNVWKAVVDS